MVAGQGSRVLVTGGAGFIGRRLVQALLDNGAEVTVADLHEPPVAGARTVLGDLRDPSVAARAVTPGTDLIVHLAALTSVLRSLEDPAGTYQTNVAMTAELLELARNRGVGTFVLASTNAVVGDVGSAVITEQQPTRPLTPYGATKAAGEMLLSCYSAAYGIAGSALRFSNVYGPGMAAKDSFVPRLMRAARDGQGVQVYGDGTQVRDLVHVDDIVAGILLAWRTGFRGPLILGTGESVTVNDIIAAARAVTGAPIPADHVLLVERGDDDRDRRQLPRGLAELGEKGLGGGVVGRGVVQLATGHWAVPSRALGGANSGHTVARPDLRSCVG
jgi:UDP-glucose 4-epimerase